MEIRNLGTIHEFDKNAAEKIRITLVEYPRGGRYVDVRIWYRPDDNKAEWIATKKGFAVSVELIDELKTGIAKAISKIEEA